MPLVAIPVVYWAAAAAVTAIGATYVWQKSGAPEKLARGINDLAANMSAADEEAEKKTATGSATDACSTCDPPPECKELGDQIKKFRDELAQRYDEMRVDQFDLFNNHYYEWQALPGVGSWKGHEKQFLQKQQGLRNRLQRAQQLGCPNRGEDAWEHATQKPPTQPMPK